jgi:hypothetical protein
MRKFILLSILLATVVCASNAQSVNVGVTTVGSGADTNSNALLAESASVPRPLLLSSMSVYVDTPGTGQMVLGIYNATGANGSPGSLLGQTAPFTPVQGWNTVNLQIPVPVPIGNLWLVNSESNPSIGYAIGQVAGSVVYWVWPVPFSATLAPTFPANPRNTGNDWAWSVYATGTPLQVLAPGYYGLPNGSTVIVP